jgi:hypothetical protein
LFSVNYMLVERETQAGWIYRAGSPGAPKDTTGWKPVQLVPENARGGRGGFPLAVEPNRSQAIWIEIYTGRGRPAGDYRGTVSIRADGATVAVPVSLKLFDFALPDKNSMSAMMFYTSDQPELYQGRNLDAEFHRFAHRQRVELVDGYDEQSLARNFGRFDGADFTRERGYEGPGEKAGNQIAPRTFYGPGALRTKESAWPKADSWMNFLAERLPSATTFLYLPDEPSARQFPEVRELAAMLHANPGPGGKLRTLVTHSFAAELDGVIDIWCTGPRGYEIERAEKERATGRDYWFYNGGRPAGGAIVIDAPATDARATIWGAFKHSIPVYFYWHSVHWRHNSQKVGNRIQDVWGNPVTFDNRGQPNKPVTSQSFANGDGVLLYPGEEKLHPEQDRGIAGPIGTVQLANFRRGLQDHQYLTLASQCGAKDVVAKALGETVPRMFSQAGREVGFSESADDYERNREALARAIEACHSKPAK